MHSSTLVPELPCCNVPGRTCIELCCPSDTRFGVANGGLQPVSTGASECSCLCLGAREAGGAKLLWMK